MEQHEAKPLYEKIITEYKEAQLRLTVNNFRGVEYFSLRKYYMDFDGTWLPTREGVTFPTDIQSTRDLFEGLAEIMSAAETSEVIEEYFGDIIKKIYGRNNK